MKWEVKQLLTQQLSLENLSKAQRFYYQGWNSNISRCYDMQLSLADGTESHSVIETCENILVRLDDKHNQMYQSNRKLHQYQMENYKGIQSLHQQWLTGE